MTSAQMAEIPNEAIFTFQTKDVVWSKYRKTITIRSEKYRTSIIQKSSPGKYL